METAFERSTEDVPIAQIQPSIDIPRSSVKGVVTLIWPYSSSKRVTSLLLVEPDFRLRRKQGQVRVVFHGSSAKAVARSGLASGDELRIMLDNVRWEKCDSTVHTPGKSVAWELHFGQKVKFEVSEGHES
jgi:hypothetical protein